MSALPKRMGHLAAVPAALAIFGATQLQAQAVLTPTVRLGPQYMSYRFGSPTSKTVSQLSIPMAFIVPLGERMTFDVATAYAMASVDSGGGESRINGLTDTQLRASYTFGTDAVVVSAGVNLPTGRETVSASEISAAGLIGNDFLSFPIGNMGTGLATTGGVALARPAGSWNVGGGVSFRRNTEFEPLDSASLTPGFERVRYTPGDEYRMRLGVDRSLAAGRLAMGLTYSMFGDDQAGGTTYGTGDRIVGQIGYTTPLRGTDVSLSAWNLTRLRGEQAGGIETPVEQITNFNVGLNLQAFGTPLEPHVEVRNWLRDGSNAGRMGSVGMRGRMDVGALSLSPNVALTMGSLASGEERASLSGWRVGLTGRLAR